jgi:putative DNA primase/helicase
LFRLVDANAHVILADEYDSWIPTNEELRGLLNAGHRKGAMVYRCEGDDNQVRAFAAYAPAVLCGIGALPATLYDRSIVIRLKRAKPNELQARFDSRCLQAEQELCRKLARWCKDNSVRLSEIDPELPEAAYNRVADNWRPLFAIAEVAGGDWPERASACFTALTRTDDLDAESLGTMLLSDIADLFGKEQTDKLPSNRIATALAEIEGRPWAEWGKHRRPISPNQIANQLHRFSIAPKVIRIGDETPRGYLLDDFQEAFERYLPDTPFQTATPQHHL